MIDEILVNRIPGETRIALLQEGHLSEMRIHRDHRRSVIGDIYLGRVVRIVQGIQAAFVEIGLEQTGFLGLSDARPRDTHKEGKDNISDHLTEGAAVLVQVTKDPIADKGPRLTTHLSLPGHYAVFTPNSPRISVSRQISDKKQRDRLFDFFKDQQEGENGFIIRTAAQEANEEALAEDIANGQAQWGKIRKARISAKAGTCLYSESDPLPEILRDFGTSTLQQVLIDDGEMCSRAKGFCRHNIPELTDRISHYSEKKNLFAMYDVEGQLQETLLRKVPLEGGGNLVIDSVTALTAIDVNSAGRSESGPERNALETNLDAAEEVAWQLSLRNISGQILVDFIGMKRHDTANNVLEAFRDAVDNRTHVIGLTTLGLVEVTRRRTTPPLSEILTEPCNTCGTGHSPSAETMAFDLIREALNTSPPPAALTAPKKVIETLQGPLKQAWETLTAQVGQEISLRVEA
ncbi:MAG: Rne/Rng family ribonuclease [Alphaproteobacteria bacterium]|nr:Rne/Rng family ribonuclease [Rhodospirillales bacterium]MCW9045090.1 Rne/Rng family ribonuclease [Alphaproteobacteria bacterium]